MEGEKGDKGEQGERGEQGIPGEPGISVTRSETVSATHTNSAYLSISLIQW